MSEWLFDTLVATSGLMLLVLLVREPVRRRCGARVAYGLWLLPAARLVMPTLTETVERAAPTAASTAGSLVRPLADEPLLLAQVAPTDPAPFDALGGWPTILGVLWLGIAAGLFLSRIAAFRRDRRIILSAASEVARVGSVRIVRSAEVPSPVAFGILDRVIAVPSDFDRLYGERERRFALDHELAHHRHGDLVANLFAFVLLCLQWFNPLAWVAHAAFRFDQEAACDARVLDKARSDDRADYARAIAKAASGRALLFASALDRRHSLKRRLASMLNSPSGGRRLAGQLMILATAAVVLPLTATRAIEYVDVAAPAPPAPPAVPAAPPAPPSPVAPLPPLPVAAIAAIAPVPPVPPVPPVARRHVDGKQISFDKGTIHIDGRQMRWDQLTPQQKARVRASIDEARRELAEARVDAAEIEREVRAELAESLDRGELQRELAEARKEIGAAMREIDRNRDELRRSGQDPERLKADIRASLDRIDVDRIVRESMASVDARAIARASAASAAQAVARAEAELDRLDRAYKED